MRIVFATQRLDIEHPTLGATVAMIGALAERVDDVVVLAGSAASTPLPSNVRVCRFAAPAQSLRGARFEAALARELGRPGPAAVLAHMSPIFAVLAAPLARPRRVPVLLWFTHWRASRLLRLGEWASAAVLSVDRTTFPIHSAKLIEIGHGIDVARFGCFEPPGGETLRLVALGRYSPAKGLETIVRALGRARAAGVDVRLDVHGPESGPADAEHRRELESLAARLGLGGFVSLGGPVAWQRVPGLLAGADALVNNMRPGAADKVVFEAAAACRPPFAAAHAFARLLPETLRFPSDDDEALADRLVAFAEVTAGRRVELGTELRARVAREHSVEHWADGVVAAATR